MDGSTGNGDFVDGSAILEITIVAISIIIIIAIVLRSRGLSGGGRVVRRPAMADGSVKTPSQFFRLFGGAQGTLVSSYSNFGVYLAGLDGVVDFLIGIVVGKGSGLGKTGRGMLLVIVMEGHGFGGFGFLDEWLP